MKSDKIINEYTVACVNSDIVFKNKQLNIENMLCCIKQAAQNGAKLIVFPEMCTTGYCFLNRQEIASFVEPISGDTTKIFINAAKQYSCYIVFGMGEVDEDTDLYYNSAVFVGPEGFIGVYRKTHLYIADARWASHSTIKPQVYKTEIGNIGLQICMDFNFFEPSRICAVNGADVIVHISNWCNDKAPCNAWITRAYENGCYVAEANRCGTERGVIFSSGSCVISPNAQVEGIVYGENEICYAHIDIDKARAKKFDDDSNKIDSRLPKQYKDICLHPYHFNPYAFFELYNLSKLPIGKQFKLQCEQLSANKNGILQNRQILFNKVHEAAKSGVELLVFPELALSGTVDAKDAHKNSESLHGNTVIEILQLCALYKIYVIFGFIESCDDKLYNSCAFCAPDGLLGVYRKNHLTAYDKTFASCGDGIYPCFDTPLGRIGLLIGHDAHFPESARLLALSGADIICCPSCVEGPNSMPFNATPVEHVYPVQKQFAVNHWHLWRTRAGENNCYIAFSNTVGQCANQKFMGTSGIFGPNLYDFPRNEVILSNCEQQCADMLIDTRKNTDSIYPNSILKNKNFVSMRQAFLYDDLIKTK